MARKQTIDLIVKTFRELGGNLNDVLGTKTNVNFLGKGKSPELMLDMDINVDALGVLPQSKAVEELTSSVGYAVSNKLNDIQANKLLSNMQKMKDFYIPPPGPANITDLATGTKNLDAEGIMSLRKDKFKKGITEEFGIPPERVDEVMNTPFDEKLGDDLLKAVDLPPPGSRGGPEDIAAPFSGAGLEAIKNVKGSNLIIDDIVDKIYLNAGVTPAAKPVARANAREFLNRVKDLEDPDFPTGTTLSSIMEADDFKFMTEGGGAGMGDPLLLVQKYFGPKVATAVTKLDSADDIQKFAENLVKIRDARGNTITSRFFDPETVDPEDFKFADGGRVPFFGGGAAAGKAFGLAMKAKNLAKGGKMGYQALRKYGIEAGDISRLFRNVAMDKSLVGEEKTAYMKQLNLVLKNPDDFPDAIKDIQIRLGLDPIGFKGGGLAKILEV